MRRLLCGKLHGGPSKWFLHRLFKEPIIGPLKFMTAEIRHLENPDLAISQRKSIRFWCNFVHNSRHKTRWQSHDQRSHLKKKSRWPTTAILKIVFGHISAADCPISVSFSASKQFFTEFRQWARYPCSTYVFFAFRMHFLLLRATAFVSSPIHLFCSLNHIWTHG